MTTRRAVIAGGGAIAAAIATSAAALAEVEAVDTDALREITEVQAAHRRARATFEEAAAAFKASIPEPHWSINHNDRERALCGSWIWVQQSRFADLQPHYFPSERTLDDDLRACARHFPERYKSYRKLTRRLKTRVMQRQQLIEQAELRFRLEELQIACDAVERRLIELADRLFDAPATTMAAVQAQAQMVVVFAEQITSQSWAYCRTGKYGRQLAENLLALNQPKEA